VETRILEFLGSLVSSLAFLPIVPLALIAAWRGRSDFKDQTPPMLRPAWVLLYGTIVCVLSISSMPAVENRTGWLFLQTGFFIMFVQRATRTEDLAPSPTVEPHLGLTAVLRHLTFGGRPVGLKTNFTELQVAILGLGLFGCGLLVHTLVAGDVRVGNRFTWIVLDASIIGFAAVASTFVTRLRRSQPIIATGIALWLLAIVGLVFSWVDFASRRGW
jgi:hypothetical protein